MKMPIKGLRKVGKKAPMVGKVAKTLGKSASRGVAKMLGMPKRAMPLVGKVAGRMAARRAVAKKR